MTYGQKLFEVYFNYVIKKNFKHFYIIFKDYKIDMKNKMVCITSVIHLEGHAKEFDVYFIVYRE